MPTIVKLFTYRGVVEPFTVPLGVSSIKIQAWGAGGGGQNSSFSGVSNVYGGGGGYASGVLAVTPNTIVSVIVGGGGVFKDATTSAFGGGGIGGNSSIGSNYYGSGGGGLSGVQYPVGTYVLIAGAGGAANILGYYGGGGGGEVGGDGQVGANPGPTYRAGGGTQTTGGTRATAADIYDNPTSKNGALYTGGNAGGVGGTVGSSSYGGAGGGSGYYGGGGTGSQGGTNSGAGAGSAYLSPILTNTITIGSIQGSGDAAGTTLPNYTGLYGQGGRANSNGNNGYVVFTYDINPLSLTKSVSTTNATTGATLTYTISLNNIYGVTLNNVVIVDTVPNGTTFVSNSLNVNGTSLANTLAPPSGYTIATVPLGLNTITFKVLVSTTLPSPNPILNIATAAYTGGYVYNSNTVATTIVSAVLSSSKSVDKTFADLGSVLTFTIPIVNTGNTTANNIVFIDTIPTNTSLVANSFKIDGTTIVDSPNPPGYTLPNGISAGGRSTITFKVVINTIPSPNPILNSALAIFSFTVDSSTTPNTVSSNNVTYTNITTTTVTNASLSSNKLVNLNYAKVGDILTYSIPLSNLGNTTTNNVVFLDTIPTNTTLVANSFKQDGAAVTGSPNPPGATLPNAIARGTVSTVTFQVLVTTIPSPNTITNSASSRYFYTVDPSVVNGANGSTNTNSVTTTIVNVAISSSKQVDKLYANIGDILTYTIPLNNIGNTTANIVVFLDTIPTNTTLVANSFKQDGISVTGSPNSPGATLPNGIAAGQISTVTFKVLVATLPTINPVLNSASNSFYFTVDPLIINIGFGSSNTNVVATTIVNATLQSSKVVNKNYADIGNILTFTIPITNVGNTTANNIVFIDTIPTNTTFVANSLKQDGTTIVGSPNPPGITLPKGIFANTTSTLTFQVIVTTIASPNPILNSALTIFSFTVDSSTTPNTVSSNNATYTNITTTTLVNVTISSSKQVNLSYAKVGDILTYSIPLSNLGNTTANNVVFLDTIPNNTTLVANSFTQDGAVVTGSPNSPGATLPNGIGAGTVSTVTFQVLVTTIPSPNPITNSASTRFSYTVDPSVTNGASGSTNTNTVTTQVNSANLVNITKFVDKSFADCGDLLTYTIILPNSGNITAVNVVLFDTIPNGTVFQSNSVKVNGLTIANSNPVNGITIPSIGAGLSATITFSVIVQC